MKEIIKAKTELIQPTGTYTLDGSITVTVPKYNDEGKKLPAKPFEFRLTKPDGTVVGWLPESSTGSRTRTFSGLGPGTYVVELDSDNSYATHTCISKDYFTLIDPCPVANPCKCGFALKVDNAISQYVKFQNRNGANTDTMPQYSNIGTGDFSIEMWASIGDLTKITHLFEWRGAVTGNPVTVFGKPSAIGDPNGQRIVIKANVRSGTGVGPTPFTTYQFDGGLSVTYETTSALNTVQDATTLITGNVLGTGLAVLKKDTMHHIVFTKVRGISAATAPVNTGCLRAHIGTTDYWILYVDGIPYSVENSNALETVTNLGPTGGNDPGFFNTGLISQQYDNLAYFLGNITLGNTDNPSNTTGANAANFKVTNFRMYRRALSRGEVQLNYIAGCAGEPSSCGGLILYAPLSQETGKVAQEVILKNHGQLMNYTGEQTVSNGGAWFYNCCPEIAGFIDFECCKVECDPEYATLNFTINTPLTVGDILITNIGLDSCPLVGNVLPASITAYRHTVAGVTAIAQAENFVSVYNALAVGPLKPAGAIATNNLATVTVKYPVDPTTKKSPYCGMVFQQCSYNSGLTAATSNDITYPAGNVVICCVPDDLCCEEETGQVKVN